MAAKKRKTAKKTTSKVGLKADGTLKKGFKFKKGGGVVKAKSKK